MAGHSYVAKGYSNYNDGYGYIPEQHVKWYVVETMTVERVRRPASGYTRFGGAPLKNEFLEINMPKYAPMDSYGGYEQYYGSGYEHSSPTHYYEGEDPMANFLNKLKIGARPPANTSNHSSTKYHPTIPNKYPPESPEKYRAISPNRYHSTSPNKYHPETPNKYQSTSPNKYRPNSPNKYRPKSPNKYKSTSPNKYRPASPNTYHPKIPNKYQSTSPTKFRPTSPNTYHPESPNKHQPISPNKYGPSSLDKHQPTIPTKYQPTSSTYTYPSKDDNTILPTPVIRYRPTSPNKHQFTSLKAYHLPREDQMNRSQDKPGPNTYRPKSPVHNFPSKEGQPIRTQSFSDPNKDNSSSLGAKGGEVDFLGPNYYRQSVGPATTRNALMTPTNNINEALGSLTESANYSPRSNPMREGAFGDLSPRAQPTEYERQYARAANGGLTDRPYQRSNTIDSHEAVRRYNGVYVP